MGEDKSFFTKTRFYVNTGTKQDPQWEEIKPPIEFAKLFETKWEKLWRIIKETIFPFIRK